MKLCLSCDAVFEVEGWECPTCHHCPPKTHGFYSFSPELAQSNDGLDENAHHMLDKMQSKSFWFRERNSLIQSSIEKYFPTAKSVLEIGCGSGYVLNGIRKVLPAAKLSATEIYANGLGYAANRVSPPCQFLQVDARRLPFRQEFDLVGAFDVLEHIEEHDAVIKNIRKSLQEGGGVILTVPQHPWLWSSVDELACHKRRYKRKELSELLRRNGFEVIEDTSFMFFLLPVMLLKRFMSGDAKERDPANELALPGWIDKTFAYVLKAERFLIKLGIRLPVGGSRLVVARLVNK